MATGGGGWPPPRPPPGFPTAPPPPQNSPFLFGANLTVSLFASEKKGYVYMDESLYKHIFANNFNDVKHVLESTLNLECLGIINCQVSCRVTSLEQLDIVDNKISQARQHISQRLTQLLIDNGLTKLLNIPSLNIFSDIYIDPSVFVIGKLYFKTLCERTVETKKWTVTDIDGNMQLSSSDHHPQTPDGQGQQCQPTQTDQAEMTRPDAAGKPNNNETEGTSVDTTPTQAGQTTGLPHSHVGDHQDDSPNTVDTGADVHDDSPAGDETLDTPPANKDRRDERTHAIASDSPSDAGDQQQERQMQTYAEAAQSGKKPLKAQETEFWLYVPVQFGEVLEVELRSENKKYPDKIGLRFDKQEGLWKSQTIKLPQSAGMEFMYKYSIKTKASLVKQVVTFGIVDKNKVMEATCRRVKACTVQKDIFWSEDDYSNENIAEGAWHFGRLALKDVSNQTLKDKISEWCDMPIVSKLKKSSTSEESFTSICLESIASKQFNTEQCMFIMLLVMHSIKPYIYILRKHVLFSEDLALGFLKQLQKCSRHILSEDTQEVLTEFAPCLVGRAFGNNSPTVCPILVALYFFPAVDDTKMKSVLTYARSKLLAGRDTIQKTILKLVDLLQQERGCADIFASIIKHVEDTSLMVELHKTVSQTLKPLDNLTAEKRRLVISCIEDQVKTCFERSISSCDITQLDVLEQILQQLSTYDKCETLFGKLEQQIRRIVTLSSNTWDEKSVRSMVNLISSEILFRQQSFTDVLEKLLEIKDEQVIKMVLGLMDSHKFKVLVSDLTLDVKYLSIGVMKQKVAVMRPAGRTRSTQQTSNGRKIQEMYELLGKLCKLDVVDEDTAVKSKDFVREWLFSHDLQFIMDCNYLFPEDVDLTVYKQHQKLYMEKAIAKPGGDMSAIHKLLGKDLKLTHSNIGVIVMILDKNSAKTYTNPEVVIQSIEAVHQIFKEIEFWKMIFCATGYQAERLTQHQSTQNVFNAVKMIGKGMKSKTLPYSLCKLVTKYIADKQQVCESVFNYILNWKKGHLLTVCNALQEECNQLETKKISSFRILEIVKEISFDVKLAITDIDETICTVSTAQTSAEALKTPLNELVEQQTAVQQWCTSDVREKQLLEAVKMRTFTALMRRELQRDKAQIAVHLQDMGLSLLFNEDTDMETDMVPTTAQQVLNYICTVCLPEYESLLQDFFYGDVQKNVCEIIIFFKDELKDKGFRRIESFMRKEIPTCTKQALTYLRDFKSTKKNAEALYRTCLAFDMATEKDTSAMQRASVEVWKIDNKLQIPLSRYHAIVHEFKERTKDVEDLDWQIINELSQARGLVGFMREVMDDDLRNLIDAVEEHSEQYVEESIVSGLIQVKKFLYPVLSQKLNDSLDEFMKHFHRCKTDNKKLVLIQLNGCNHNLHQLRVLYHSVTNRGEVTKEIVTNIVKKGVVSFSIAPGKEDVFVQVKKSKTIAKYHLHDLEDLRSRSLLIIYNDREKKEDDANNMKQFILVTDLIREIWSLLKDLHHQGHFHYKEFEWKSSKQGGEAKAKQLDLKRDELVKVQNEWTNDLETARRQFYYLNFIHSEQLWLLQDYFDGKSPALQGQALSIMKYINPSIASVTSVPSSKCQKGTLKNKLDALGENLQAFAEQEQVATPLALMLDLPKSAIALEACVQPGELYMAHIDVTFKNAVPVLLALYGLTVSRLPLPFELLFCCGKTTEEEVHLLLNRCFYNPRKDQRQNLFTIVNVETLQYEVREVLVERLRQVCSSVDTDVLLALTCTADAFHPMLVEFSRYVHKVPGLARSTMEQLFQKTCPNASMITSEVPGLGKTEHIFEKASKLSKTVHTVDISGSVVKADLAMRLSEIPSTENVLHFNIGLVDDPVTLDTFLFELIFLKCAVSETVCVQIPSEFIAIEVANSLQHKLRDDLFLMTCLKREHLIWTHFRELIVSKEIHSPVQVVCQYLQAKQDGTLGTKDLLFHGSKTVMPLSATACQSILSSCLGEMTDLSYSVLNIFLNVLAEQLLKLSNSHYFRVSNLSAMFEKSVTAYAVRTQLVDVLISMAKEFACRSIHSCRSQQTVAMTEPIHSETGAMLSRVDRMVKWTDSNHFVVVFQSQNIQAVTPLYRSVTALKPNIKSLFDSQLRKPLLDYKGKPQSELQRNLEQVVCKQTKQSSKKELLELMKRYTLTSDNLLKMILIMLRLRNRLPVLLMGETGCGKTSLIRYLAMTCGVHFELYSIHAGITKKDMTDKIETINNFAYKNPTEDIWLFLDEINTCDHLGIISNILCERKIQGMRVAPNLVCLAACNPYRLRNMERAYTAGLGGKKSSDQYSQLVYRVYPLPENLVDYVWDYGSLDTDDEKEYISCMVKNSFDSSVCKSIRDSFVGILCSSQDYIRRIEGNTWCVSLRDVDRCKTLVKWFTVMLKEKNKHPLHGGKSVILDNVDDRAYIALLLALSICYEVRLQTAEERLEYWDIMLKEFPRLNSVKDVQNIQKQLQDEQLDILNRMDIPDGIAKNTALRENVFVLFVCILNKIPIFLVGKPGCSKSLSMQLLKSNLRGLDSSDSYFQTLPHIYVVAYQGSEASTSEGIIKVFEKAENYQKKRVVDENILPVVLLDEIGLAEISQNNPLKVLHGLLEPNTALYPSISVVGISNWALDSAKMNRAIHLSRPELSPRELYDTGRSISIDFCDDSDDTCGISDETLHHLAEAYFEYYTHQALSNFHGLRDYYSLIKYIAKELVGIGPSRSESDVWKLIHRGLRRNFSGLPSKFESISILKGLQEVHVPTVQELIKENIEDKDSRHLLIITRGDSVISLLTVMFESLDRDYRVIYGSSFEDDQSEEYNYQVLSRIIHCMEQGVLLVLKDLDEIYGSLYDMLNQNYTIVGKRKNCRIAHGAHSNPMCPVHEDFRCIVLIDEDKVDFSDPPFLNRFEKQVMNFDDMVLKCEQQVIDNLELWVKEVSEIPGYSSAESDAFLGYHKDNLVCLTKEMQNPETTTKQDTGAMCKSALLWTCPADAIVRLYTSDIAAVDELVDDYLQLPLSKGLTATLEELLHNKVNLVSSGQCKKMICYTYSNIHFDVASLLSTFHAEILHLGSVKSEKHLTSKINKFFSTILSELLVIQCHVTADAQHLLVAKLEMERQRSNYLSAGNVQEKHMLIIVHLDRIEKAGCHSLHLNYSGGWSIFAIDTLDVREQHFTGDPGEVELQNILGKTPHQLLQTPFCEISECVTKHLFWAFSTLKYQSQERQPEGIKLVVNEIRKRPDLTDRLIQTILSQLSERDVEDLGKNHWQVQVACNRQILIEEGSLTKAWKKYLSDLVKAPLACIIWKIENCDAWGSLIKSGRDTELMNVWFNQYERLCIESNSEQKESGHFSLEVSCPILDTAFPFIRIFVNNIKYLFDIILTDIQIADQTVESISELVPEDMIKVLSRYCSIVENVLVEVYGDTDVLEDHWDTFATGLCEQMTWFPDTDINTQQRAVFCKLFFDRRIKALQSLPHGMLLTSYLVTFALEQQLLFTLLKLLGMCKHSLVEEIMTKLVHNNETVAVTDQIVTAENEAVSPDNEEDNDEDTNTSDEVEDTEELLLETVIVHTFPSLENEFESCEKWAENSRIKMGYCNRLGCDAKSMHVLRFCFDLYKMFIQDGTVKQDCLLQFTKLALHSDDCVSLEADPVFQYICGEFKTVIPKGNERKLQKLTCLYFARCLDSSDNCSDVIEQVLKIVAQDQLPNRTLDYCGPLLQCILFDLEELILDHRHLEISKNDEELKTLSLLHSAFLEYQGCQLSRLCQGILLKKFAQCLRRGTIREDLKCHFDAFAEVVSEKLKHESTSSFFSCYSTAFIMFYLTLVAEYMTTQSIEADFSFFQTIDGVLSQFQGEDEVGVSAYAINLLNRLKYGSVKELQTLCQRLEQGIPMMKNIIWPKDDISLGVGFNILSLNPKYQEVKDAFQQMPKEKKLKELVAKAKDDTSLQQGLMGAAADELYWPNYIHAQQDTKKELAEWLSSQCESFDEKVRDILLCLTGRKGFTLQLMNISQQHDYTDILISSVLLQIVQCFLPALDCQNPCSLIRCCIAPNTIQSETFTCARETPSLIHKAVNVYCCHMNHYIVTLEQIDKCTICGASGVRSVDEDDSYRETDIKVSCISLFKGDLRANTPTEDIFYLLYEAFLLAGCSYGAVDTQSQQYDVTQLMQSFKQRWNLIRCMLDQTKLRYTFKLHKIISDISTIVHDISEVQLSDFLTSVIVNDLLLEEQALNEFMEKVYVTSTGKQECFLGDKSFPSVSRTPKMATITHMKGVLSLVTKSSKRFPFLGLLLQREMCMNTLKCLLPILAWQKMVHQTANHHLTRAESKAQDIQTFIQDSRKKDELKHTFDAFLKSLSKLQEMCANDSTIRNLMRNIEIPQLDISSPVGQCIVERDNHFLVDTIRCLIGIHNHFLFECASLALDGCSTLDFMIEKGVACIETVSISNIKEKRLIEVQWSDDLLRFAQNKVMDGCEQGIDYDFDEIEKELAQVLILGKVAFRYTPQRTVFKNEMFHWCSHILLDIKQFVPQTQITNDMKNAFKKAKCEYPQDIRATLDFLEIVIGFMYKTRGQQVESLLPFAEKWDISLQKIDSKDIIFQLKNYLTLEHVVELYEFLEEELSEFVIEAISGQYAKPLPPSSREDFCQFLKQGYVPVEAVDTAMKRFVVRYLSHDDMTRHSLSPSLQMEPFICEPNMWSRGVDEKGYLTSSNGSQGQKLSEVFPKSLYLEHVKSCWDMVIEQIEKTKQQPESRPVQSLVVKKKKQQGKKKSFFST